MGRGRAEDSPASTGADDTVRSAVTRFVLLSVLAALLLAGVAVVVAERIARERALDSARAVGTALATRLVSPLVDSDLREGDPAARERLAAVMRNRMQDGSIRHVKVWAADGTVLWSNQARLVGKRFDLPDDVRGLLGSSRARVEVSELSREENYAEQDEGPLLEVYVGARDDDGQEMVVEAYLATEQMERDAENVVVSLVGLAVGSLGMFLAVVMPLAVALGRRVRRAERGRAVLLRHVLLASELERRRIAAALHDGVIQDLAGLGYALPAVARSLPPEHEAPGVRRHLDHFTDLVRDDVTKLRRLMSDIHPPDLAGAGLAESVQELVASESAAAGVESRVTLAPDLELTPDAARLAYRVVREGVRNVVKHAGAQHLDVDVRRRDGQVLVRVSDDGRGPLRTQGDDTEAHLGLRLLHDAVHDLGGRLDLTATSPAGTELSAAFPEALVTG